jgi:glycosyltransferase involved in cell wall biosynthesis
MSSKLLSIVIPSYNQGQYIRETLESVLAQKSDDIEVLVIDGGSTDNSVEVIKEYADRLDYWVSEADRGQSHAFNKGFQRASGHYLTWVNSDDLFLAGTVNAFRDFVTRRHLPDWVAANSMWVDVEGRILNCTVNAGWSEYARKSGAMTVTGPSSFFSKALLERVGWLKEDYHYSMDTELWYRFANEGVRYETMNHFVWALRLHPDAKVSGGDFDPNHPSIAKRAAETASTRNCYYPEFKRGALHRLWVACARVKRMAKFRSLLLTKIKQGKKASVDAFSSEGGTLN